MQPRRHRIVAFVARGIALVATFALAGDALAADLSFRKLNRTYSDFVPPIEEFNESGVSVKLVSPRQALTLRDHRLRLTPGENGLFTGALELDIQGKGTILADVAFGPLAERFNEEVLVPPQTLKIDGKIRLRRIDSGYAIDPVELPREISVAIQSPTVNAILALCDQAAILSLGSIECEGLDRALTRPTLALPAGESFTLQDSELTDEDRAALDALIAPPAV
jgi:hypothetical protein